MGIGSCYWFFGKGCVGEVRSKKICSTPALMLREVLTCRKKIEFGGTEDESLIMPGHCLVRQERGLVSRSRLGRGFELKLSIRRFYRERTTQEKLVPGEKQTKSRASFPEVVITSLRIDEIRFPKFRSHTFATILHQYDTQQYNHDNACE